VSILGDQTILDPVFIGFVVLLAISVALAVMLRVYRVRTVAGPDRVGDRRAALRLVLAMIAGFCVSVLVAIQYESMRGLVPHNGQPAPLPTPADSAFLAIASPLAFFFTLLVADWMIGGFELLIQLGIAATRIPAGVARGMLGVLVILPPTYALNYVAEWVYTRMKMTHPTEHPLLKLMHEPQDPKIKWALIVAAVFVAPLFEEYLFRGHIQTLIRRAIISLAAMASGTDERGFPIGFPPSGIPISPAVDPSQPPTLSYAVPVVPIRPAVWQTWLAILITSALFAAVHWDARSAHPLWMAPPIFFLSLGLGYCYERTGNLWTSITVHCLFNSISTFLYLNFQQP
jgi:membrane protease YdiL (CAAX protease family)